MAKFLKPGTGACLPIRFHARQFGAALVLLTLLFSTLACNMDFAGIIELPVQQPTSQSVQLTPRPTLGQATAIIISPPPATETAPTLTLTKSPPILY